MKKISLFIVGLMLSSTVNAADLMQAYFQALVSDPTYQQAVAQSLAIKQGVPIARSQLFPQVGIVGGPSINSLHVDSSPPLNSTSKGYSFTLSISQTVFNYAQFKALSGAKQTCKQAEASLNAAAQDLMLRVANAYFNVLRAEENVNNTQANRKAYAQQYQQINEQYKVGLKTVTDLYTAKASYDIASAQYIAARTSVLNAREDLRAITGMYYPRLAKLSRKFPLLSPHPKNIDAWVHTAQQQNWTIQAALYGAQAARENIKQQFAGHLPTLNLQGTYNVAYNSNLGGSNVTNPGSSSTTDIPIDGSSVPSTNTFGFPLRAHTRNAGMSLNLGVPIFQGGLVVAQTNQAKFSYQAAIEQLEQSIRTTIATTRKSYLGIIAGIQQIHADEQAIKSSLSSLQGLREGYGVGTQTLVDVLNQQQKVFQSETAYAADRYDYVNELLALKNATGTLSEDDLRAVNTWLMDSDSHEYDSILYQELIKPTIDVPAPNALTKVEEKNKKLMIAKLDVSKLHVLHERDYTLSP